MIGGGSIVWTRVKLEDLSPLPPNTQLELDCAEDALTQHGTSAEHDEFVSFVS